MIDLRSLAIILTRGYPTLSSAQGDVVAVVAHESTRDTKYALTLFDSEATFLSMWFRVDAVRHLCWHAFMVLCVWLEVHGAHRWTELNPQMSYKHS